MRIHQALAFGDLTVETAVYIRVTGGGGVAVSEGGRVVAVEGIQTRGLCAIRFFETLNGISVQCVGDWKCFSQKFLQVEWCGVLVVVVTVCGCRRRGCRGATYSGCSSQRTASDWA